MNVNNLDKFALDLLSLENDGCGSFSSEIVSLGDSIGEKRKRIHEVNDDNLPNDDDSLDIDALDAYLEMNESSYLFYREVDSKDENDSYLLSDIVIDSVYDLEFPSTTAISIEGLFEYRGAFIVDVVSAFKFESQAILLEFSRHTESMITTQHDFFTHKYAFVELVKSFTALDIKRLKKDDPMVVALWVVFLRVVRENLHILPFKMKYSTPDELIKIYEHRLNSISEDSCRSLCDVANCMDLFLRIINVKTTMGFALSVVTKLLHGFQAMASIAAIPHVNLNDLVDIFKCERGLDCKPKRKRVVTTPSVFKKNQAASQKRGFNFNATLSPKRNISSLSRE
jgi:hypothetical protein